MNLGKTLFAQSMEFVPWRSFARIVARCSGDTRVSALPSTEHFRILAYAQLTWRESLRDIEVTLGANPTKLYAMREGERTKAGACCAALPTWSSATQRNLHCSKHSTPENQSA